MTSTLEPIQDPIYDKKLHQVSADLKQYRLNQLKRMKQTNSTLLVDYLNSRTRKKRDRQKALDDIKDENLKAELAKGNTLINYTEYQPQ